MYIENLVTSRHEEKKKGWGVGGVAVHCSGAHGEQRGLMKGKCFLKFLQNQLFKKESMIGYKILYFVCIAKPHCSLV